MDVSGASHVSFSVRDLGLSVAWYRAVFGAEAMLDEPGDERSAVVLTLPSTQLLVGLTQFTANPDADFDPTRTGLDHFAFSVDSHEALTGWAAHLDRCGVEHSGPIDIPPGAILNFKDRDGIASLSCGAAEPRRPPTSHIRSDLRSIDAPTVIDDSRARSGGAGPSPECAA